MATFLAMQQEVADRLNIDQTVAANATRLKRWLNLIQQDITSRYPFDWLFEREILQTVVDRTAGTVSVANGSTAVTGTSTAFAATDVFCFIQFEGDTNWYEVSVVNSATSVTLAQNYGGTAVVDGTYPLRTFYYSLATGAFEIFDMRQTSTPAKLTCLGFWTLDSYQPNIQTVGPPVAYALFREDPSIAATTAKKNQIALFPIPDAVYNIDYKYRKVLSDLTADGDIAQLPRPYHSVMIDGAEWMGSKYLNLANQDQLKAAYEYSIDKLIARENSHKDWLPVLGSNDTQLTSRFLPFPTTFEQPK